VITIYVHPTLGNLYRQIRWTTDGRVALDECDERGELTSVDCCQIVQPRALSSWRHYHLAGTPGPTH